MLWDMNLSEQRDSLDEIYAFWTQKRTQLVLGQSQLEDPGELLAVLEAIAACDRMRIEVMGVIRGFNFLEDVRVIGGRVVKVKPPVAVPDATEGMTSP